MAKFWIEIEGNAGHLELSVSLIPERLGESDAEIEQVLDVAARGCDNALKALRKGAERRRTVKTGFPQTTEQGDGSKPEQPDDRQQS